MSPATPSPQLRMYNFSTPGLLDCARPESTDMATDNSAATRTLARYISPLLMENPINPDSTSDRNLPANERNRIDSPRRFCCKRLMGALRSPHEATSPSIASRISSRGRTIMSAYTMISADKLSKLIGTSNAPVLIDCRTDEHFAADQRLIPGAGGG